MSPVPPPPPADRPTPDPTRGTNTAGPGRTRRRERRRAKWDHPTDRRSWRYAVGLLGRTLIAMGILMFGFIAYLLWGTGLETARAQRDLSDRFEQSLAAASDGASDSESGTEADTGGDPSGDPGVTDDDTPDATATDTTGTDAAGAGSDTADPGTGPADANPDTLGVDQGIGPFEPGEPVARLEIPSLGIDEIIVAGVGVSELKLGPGHFPETPLPGQYGRASIAGHRTTYGQPFRYIDRLVPGDLMIATTQAGRFVYEVTDSLVVLPTDYQVVNTTFPEFANLTLVSCHPAFSSSRRLVVNGMLVSELSDPVGRAAPYATVADGTLPTEDTGAIDTGTGEAGDTGDGANTTDTGAPETDDTDESGGTGTSGSDPVGPTGASPETSVETATATDQPSASLDDAFGDGWFDDPGAPAQVALWGAVLAAIGVVSFLISRATRRDLVGLGIGLIPFSVAAFFFFVNVHRLLPAGL